MRCSGGTFGKGNWEQPKYTTCGGELLLETPTYSAFWTGFGVRCPRLQRLASSVGLGTTARVGARKNLAASGRKTRAWRVLRLAEGDSVFRCFGGAVGRWGGVSVGRCFGFTVLRCFGGAVFR